MGMIVIGYQNNVYRLLEGYFKTIRIIFCTKFKINLYQRRIFLCQIQNEFVLKGKCFWPVALLGTGSGQNGTIVDVNLLELVL